MVSVEQPEADVEVETPLKPTEDSGKVAKALLNLFPDLSLEFGQDLVRGRGHTLLRLKELLFNQRIRDSAREIMLGGIAGDLIAFHLSKQAAYVNKVSFSAQSPLGSISVLIRTPDPLALVDTISPRTIKPR